MLFRSTVLAGGLILGIAKILDNMELGHNVIHGQFDWMGDPCFQGKTFEWDIVGTSDNWRKTHNFKHHTYTNVHGMDDDIGYDVLRIFPEQKWHPAALLQPLYAVIFALLFCIMACMGVVFPVNSVIAMQHFAPVAGTASAILGTLQFGIGAASGVVMGAWSDGTGMPMASMMLISFTLAALVWFRR